MSTTLLPQNGTAGTVGTATLFDSAATTRTLQFNPQSTLGFTGTVVIEGSSAGSPGSNDWVSLANVVFSAHTQNFSINMFTGMPWMRARITAGTVGAVSVYASA